MHTFEKIIEEINCANEKNEAQKLFGIDILGEKRDSRALLVIGDNIMKGH